MPPGPPSIPCPTQLPRPGPRTSCCARRSGAPPSRAAASRGAAAPPSRGDPTPSTPRRRHSCSRLQFVNLQYKKLWWEAGRRFVKLRSTKALKTIEKHGLDAVARKAGSDLNKRDNGTIGTIQFSSSKTCQQGC
ncbi:uncharacterized protein LOC120661222 [Panicum virgatum]|uniref:uncharacterized protein LOC120661222 n=1 Tax=Panicum virgatum TaxID=38727 RepID=UPI0019D5BB99|nr:uncharacterized protein LOC120661222 [Panicum virgatum]